jgi:ferritin-like metal-binding protein YciE
MAYKTLSIEEQHDLIVRTYYGNEADLFSHMTNKERFESILATATDPEWRARIQNLLDDTNKRIMEVQSILEATDPQLPSDVEIAASMARIKERDSR